MDGEPPPPPDFSGLSLADKLAHKVWKARVAGYEEAVKFFKRIDDEKSSEYSKYAGLIKKFVTDSNALAQDKGLDAALVFVEYAAIASKIANEVVEGVVLKCLNQKPKTKEKALNICLMFVEIEQAAGVQEEVMKGFESKQPKIVAASIEVLTKCVQAFGPKVMNIKLLMKGLPKLFEHSDKNVREQAKGLATELFRWLRDALKPSLSGIKPVQLKELEDSWAALPTDPARPTRLLRSQQAKAAEAPAAAAAGDGGDAAGADESAAAEEIDPYDLIEAVPVLQKLPGDFYDKLAEKKWQERKESLDALLELVSQPKLAAGSYGELLQALKRVVTKDTNVMLVAIGAKCVALLGIGLRKEFAQYVGPLFLPFLEKFKEKKAAVVSALRETMDAMLTVSPVSNHIEDILAAGLESKNPAVRTETISLLTRAFCKSSPAMIPKPMLKQLCPVLLKKFDDTTPQVRDATAECLGTLLKLMGERAMTAYLADLDKSRTAKVTEAAEKAEITPPKGAAGPAKKAAAPPAAAAAAAAPAKSAPAAAAAAEASVGDEPAKAPARKRPMLSSERKKVAKAAEEGGTGDAAAPAAAAAAEPAKAAAPPAKKPPVKRAAAAAKPAASKPSGSKPSAAAAASGGKAKSGGGKGGDGGPFKEPEGPPEPSIAAEEVDDRAAEVFPADLLKLLDSKAWKERLEGYEKLTEFLQGTEETHTYLVVKVMAKKPGWKDSNFQVMKAKFEMVSFLAKNKPFGKKSAHCAFPGLVDKLSDIKVKGTSCDAMSAIAEALSLNYVSLQVSKLALEHKSPKVQQEALTWLNNALKEFGLAINIKPHIDYIKTCLGATNQGVRTAAISLLGTAHLFLGAQLRMFFEEEKPALLAQIDAEFEKVKDERPPTPTRGPKAGEEQGGGGGGGGGGAASLADLMPRNDISGQIKSGLITELGDKQWKVREEALSRVTEIITTAKFITPALGDLPGALKSRLADSNKNLVVTTLNILASIATAMGPAVKKFLPIYGTATFHVLSDAKPQVRLAAVNCLNAYYAELKLNAFLEGGYIATGLSTENPNLRGELLVWYEQKLGEAGSVPGEVKETVGPLYSCLEDRSGDVRKKAQLVLPAIMSHIGIDFMIKATSKLKGSSKQTIMALLEKHRSSAPATASSASAASGSGKTAAASKTSSAGGAAAKTSSKPGAAKAKAGTSSVASRASSAASGSAGASAAASSSASSGAQGSGEEDDMPLTGHGGKEQRMKADRDNKILKWNFTAPRPEHLDQLKEQLTPCVSKKQFTEMFHADFKHHIVALDALLKVVTPDASGVAPQQSEVLGILDLLLRWVSLRFFDTNTSVLLKALNYLECTFKLLGQQNYHLNEYEASAFLPYLVQKVGDAKDPVRKAVRGLFHLVCDVYPASKMYVYIVDGTQCKNSRQRIECLEELACLIERHTINVCQPSVPKAVSSLCAHISDRDNSVRSAALNALVGVYAQLEEAMFWKYLGTVSEKERSLLEERIKRSGKKSMASAATSKASAPGSTVAAPSAGSKLSQPGSKLPAAGDKKTIGGIRPPQSRSGSAASTAPASSNTGAIPASATSSNSSTSSAGSAGSLSSGAIAAPAAAMSQTVGVVKGDHFSIDLSGPEFTVDPGLVPPVQLKNAGNVGELVHPYSVPERISARLGSRLHGISSTAVASSFSHMTSSRPSSAAMTSLVSPARSGAPVTSTPISRPASSAAATMPAADQSVRSESVRSFGMSSSNSLTSSANTSTRPVTTRSPSSLDNLLRQLTSAQLPTALQALKELESQMQIPEVVDALSKRVDDLLLSLAQQLQIACSIHALRSKSGSPDDLMRLLKYVVHVQVPVLQQASLAQSISRRGLTQLLWQLLASLKDESLLALPDVSQLHRTINILFVRYFETCRPNETLGSVIELLGQCCQEGSSRANLTELVLKCLWRLTRMLDKLLPNCQLDRLFLDLHNFLVMHPSSVWRQRANNIPLRSIKTIIHHIAEKVGPNLMNHLTLVENVGESELMLFLQKRLMSCGATATVPTVPGTLPSSSGAGVDGVAAVHSQNTAPTGLAQPAASSSTMGAPDNGNGESRMRAPLLSSSRDNVSHLPGSMSAAAVASKADKPALSSSESLLASAPASVTTPIVSLSAAPGSSRQFKPLSSSARQQLANIVSKIGARENSQQGLQELYDFVQSHPDANISPLFDVCSPEFRNFVEKSLRNIARQRSREGKAPASSTSVGGMQDNLDSLRSLLPSGGRAASGESAGAVATNVHAETTIPSSTDATLASGNTLAAAKSNQDTLESFRRRLDRIREPSPS